MRGEAESFAIQAKAKAEAEQMAKKADAWKEYKSAALVDMVLNMLPKVCLRFSFFCVVFQMRIGALQCILRHLTGCCRSCRSDDQLQEDNDDIKW